jgi:hypothetical protein
LPADDPRPETEDAAPGDEILLIGPDEEERRRRELAQRLARELADPPPDGPPEAFSEFVAARAMRVRYASAVDVHVAFDEAQTVITMGDPTLCGWVRGRAGLVMYAHGPGDIYSWSVVFPFVPFTGLALVCLDDLDDQCLWVSADGDPEAAVALEELQAEIWLGLKARDDLIARGLLPAGPQCEAPAGWGDAAADRRGEPPAQ